MQTQLTLPQRQPRRNTSVPRKYSALELTLLRLLYERSSLRVKEISDLTGIPRGTITPKAYYGNWQKAPQGSASYYVDATKGEIEEAVKRRTRALEDSLSKHSETIDTLTDRLAYHSEETDRLRGELTRAAKAERNLAAKLQAIYDSPIGWLVRLVCKEARNG